MASIADTKMLLYQDSCQQKPFRSYHGPLENQPLPSEIACNLYAQKSPERKSKFRRKLSPTWGETWRTFGELFFADFRPSIPGKVTARNFTKNPPQTSRAAKETSFTARLWELESPTIRDYDVLRAELCRPQANTDCRGSEQSFWSSFCQCIRGAEDVRNKQLIKTPQKTTRLKKCRDGRLSP